MRQLQQNLREAQDRIRHLEGIAREATEEANRLKSSFSGKEKLFQTELRKRERDFEKLRDQLQTCLREPVVILQSIPRTENTFDMAAVRASLANSRSSLDSTAMDSESNHNQNTDRIEVLEHENENLRQLLSSTNQILSQLRGSLQSELISEGAIDVGELKEPLDLSAQISCLPVTRIYDHIKEEIESSLNIISDFVNSQL